MTGGHYSTRNCIFVWFWFWLFGFGIFETGFLWVALAGLELRNLPVSASQSAGITGMHHHCLARFGF